MRTNLLKNIPAGQFELSIEKVVYNGPATTIIWSDGTKTTAKCHGGYAKGGALCGDVWDPEKGFAMALAKRFMTYGAMKKYIPDEKRGPAPTKRGNIVMSNR